MDVTRLSMLMGSKCDVNPSISFPKIEQLLKQNTDLRGNC